MLRAIQNILLQDSGRLIETLGLDPASARIEVQCLLQQVLKVSRAYLLAYPERILSEPEQTLYDALLQRRLSGEPIAYILGEREFFGLSFKVTPATLIPRPETELLVEMALQRIPHDQTCHVLDLGTGSGAIAIAIAHERPKAIVLACDSAAPALDVARENAAQFLLSNLSFVASDWFQQIGGMRFDIIVSNPPYVSIGDLHLTQGDVRFEPLSALVSGPDGLHDIRWIIAHSKQHLKSNGWLLLEHGYDQAAQVRELLRLGEFKDIFSARDLSGIERVSGGAH